MSERNELIEQRYKNLEKLKKAGINPFMESFSDIESISELKNSYTEGKSA